MLICNLRSVQTSELKGDVDLSLQNFTGGKVVAAFEELSRNSGNFTDLRINYYCSAVTDNESPTTVDDLIKLIKAFPSKMSKIEQGIPIEVTFLHHLAL